MNIDHKGNLVYWRVPKSLKDIEQWINSSTRITWEEANEWVFIFKYDFLDGKNKTILEDLLKKGIENFNLRLQTAKFKKGFNLSAQRFVKNYISMPILMIQTRAELESLCKNLVENVEALTKEYNKNTKINFEVATEELIKHLSIDLLELLEQPSIENDVKVSSFLRRLNFPIQSMMLLKDNTDKKSKLIIAASSLDLLQNDMEGEEMNKFQLFENYSPFNSSDELKEEYLSLLDKYESDNHILKSYARFLLIQQDELDELYSLLLIILKKIPDQDHISKKAMAQMALTALQLNERRKADPILISDLKDLVDRYLEIKLDNERVAIIENFHLLSARLRYYKKNKSSKNYEIGLETSVYILDKLYPNPESEKLSDSDRYKIKQLKQFISSFKKLPQSKSSL